MPTKPVLKQASLASLCQPDPAVHEDRTLYLLPLLRNGLLQLAVSRGHNLYTCRGEFGLPPPPNSDEILLKFECHPKAGLNAYLTYQLIRHGTNDVDGTPGDLIYGDIYIPYNYARQSYYPDKNFLKDGIYDWSNIVSVGGSYRFKNFPAKIGIGYIFSHTFWDTNGLSVTTPESITQNIISITYTLFK